ncbi:MAG: hypothetical protein ACRDOS_00665 [Gaiellaceae bacterium]
MTEQQQLAFDLYSASFSEESADARFLLMMAVETLLEPQKRSEAVAAHEGETAFLLAGDEKLKVRRPGLAWDRPGPPNRQGPPRTAPAGSSPLGCSRGLEAR